MPRVASKLAELDEAAARVDCLEVDASFPCTADDPDRLSAGARMVVRIESPSAASGYKTFGIGVAYAEGRRTRASEPFWQTRGKKLSSLLQSFAKKFPGVNLPP